MKLSEKLFREAEKLWKEASEKEFLIDMAKGTLSKERYKNYMLQDYFYLLDYKKIVDRLLELSDDSELSQFLKVVEEVIVDETENVHIPAMKDLGISDLELDSYKNEEVLNNRKNEVIKEYIGYYNDQISQNGLLAGLVALLQCSWDYAYLGKIMYERYRDDIERSQYKFWFDAYTSQGYVETNQKWIEMVDKHTADIDIFMQNVLCGIFRTCAGFENKFWNVL